MLQLDCRSLSERHYSGSVSNVFAFGVMVLIRNLASKTPDRMCVQPANLKHRFRLCRYPTE